MALRYDEDTEFNEALRARGIIPQKPPKSRTPSPEPEPAAIDMANLSDDEDLLALEAEELPTSVLENYRAQRLQEAKQVEKTHKYSGITPISRDDYTREVTEASKIDCEGGGEGHGTGVVCFLWNDSVPESVLLRRHLEKLAVLYPATKFVSIKGDMCIPNYPDKNIPTLLIYRKGQLVKQIVTLTPNLGMKGMQTTVQDLEALFIILTACDPALKLMAAPKPEDEEEDEDEGLGRRSKIRTSTLADGFTD